MLPPPQEVSTLLGSFIQGPSLRRANCYGQCILGGSLVISVRSCPSCSIPLCQSHVLKAQPARVSYYILWVADNCSSSAQQAYAHSRMYRKGQDVISMLKTLRTAHLCGHICLGTFWACPVLLKQPKQTLPQAITSPYCTVITLNIVLPMGMEGPYAGCSGAHLACDEPLAVSHMLATLVYSGNLMSALLPQLLWLRKHCKMGCGLPEISCGSIKQGMQCLSQGMQDNHCPQSHGTFGGKS